MITYAGFLPLVSFEQDGDGSETSWFMFIPSYSDKITKKSNEIKHAKITTPKLCFCRRQRCTTASRNPCKQRKSLMRMRSWGKPTSCRPSSLLPSWILRSLLLYLERPYWTHGATSFPGSTPLSRWPPSWKRSRPWERGCAWSTPSYPASSFPLTSGLEIARLVKPACAVRDEDSRYEIAWSREVVISRVLRQVSSALDHFKVKSTSCQRFKEHNEVTSLSLYRFVSNFSLYFSRALRLWLVEGDSLSWFFFFVYRDVWIIRAFCDVSSICVFAKCKLCCVWFLFATNFELISLSWSCRETIFAWWNTRSWSGGCLCF